MRVRFEPFGVTTEVDAGMTLLEAANLTGVEIESVCGGRGTCGKCKVIVSGGVSAPTSLELRDLTVEERRNGYRLACQTIIESDVEVIVPEGSRRSRVSILSEGIQREVPLDPWARRHVLRVSDATLENQLSDLERVRKSWNVQVGGDLKLTLRALRQLPFAIREREGYVSLIQVDDHVVCVEAGDNPEHVLGIAFDIGTTTVAGYLLDLESGEELAVASLLNPQTRHGDDVVSRIAFSTSQPDGLDILRKEIVGALNEIIANTTKAAGVAPHSIFAMTVVGNTTMHHLFLGISPEALARSPYVPVVMDALSLASSDLGIDIYPDARIWMLPNIAGWVGADTVGVILATGLHQQDEMALAIDIGTNGEMALGSRARLVACSTAAGPAFEGAQLSCGMRAADGAIDAVHINNTVQWHTIGETTPRGVCGSGLVDLIAEMLRGGIISTTGMMQSDETLRSDGHHELAERIVQVGRHREFDLVRAEEGADGHGIRVTQRDVRELQLAKGAIRAGIELLLKELNITPHEVKRVYLAGAFGNYIRPSSALGIGLMPTFPNAEIIPVGNAAGSGAKVALLSREVRNEASEIMAHVEYMELSGRPDFQEEFSEAMIF